MNLKSSKKGISLLLTVLIVSVLLAIGLGLSAIFLREIKIIREMGNSVVAFYAADSGIEEILMNREIPVSSCVENNPCPLDNGAKYFLEITDNTDPNCDADYYCIKSVGSYQGTKRAIEIKY